MSEPFLRSRPDAGGGFDQQSRRPTGTFNREDPLAELARLVGKDDPFRTASPRPPASNVSRFPQPASPAAHPEHDETSISAEDDGIGDYHEPGYPDFDAQLRGSLDARAAEEARPRDSLRFPAANQPEALFEPSLDGSHEAQQGHAPPLNADLWAEGALPQQGEPADYEAPYAEQGDDGRSSRRTVMVLAAVLVLVCGGIGATYLMHGNAGVMTSDGAPPTIMAADTPVKVASPDVANGGTPDSNTALLEKTNSDKVDHAKVVANNEQPVDLNQLPKPASAQPETAQPAPAAPAGAFPEPRKVKTVMIRPDGSVVGEASPQPAPAAPIGMTMPAGVDNGAAQTADTPPAAAETPVAKPSTPKSTARVATTPKDAAASGGASGAKQAAAPAHTPKPKPVAVAETTPAEEPAAAAPGTWSVQLAAPPTEQDAKDTAARLQKKFADQLGGSKLSVRKASDKAVYRVRVGSLSQDDAKALCGKLQAAGGSCFTVRN